VFFLAALLLVIPAAAGASGKSRRASIFLATKHTKRQGRLAADSLTEAQPKIDQASHGRAGVLKGLYPWYHTSSEIQSEARRLSQKCNGALSIRTLRDSGVGIDVARVRAPGASPTNRVFIMFGEHSRELISPESGLGLLKMLCGEESTEPVASSASSVLQGSEFELVLNGNPRSRLKVEDGEFCLRMNPTGVDLNRNWDEQWTPDSKAYSNAFPGPHPFSEPETRIFKQLVTAFKPTTFLTVHSGTRGLYMPWAYDTQHMARRNKPAMLEILREIDKGHCQCPYGAAGKEVGYSCPGTCLDWVYDQLNTPFSFAFEIYTNPDEDDALRSRWDRKIREGGSELLYQNGAHLGHEHFASLFEAHASDFVHRRARSRGAETPESCFGQFNPDTQERYNQTVTNWAQAYLELAQHTTKLLQGINGSEVA
jgi:hypothetical protein